MNKIYVIFDCSGSMAESGRCAVLKSTFLAVRRRYSNIVIYRWNEEFQPIDKAKEIIAQASANVEILSNFYGNLNDNPDILLISDGCWSNRDAEAICSATMGHNVYSCAIGQEANLANLRKVQTIGRKPFRMVDFPTVIEHLLRK